MSPVHPLPDGLRRLCSYLACAWLVLGIATLPLSVRSAGNRTYPAAHDRAGEAVAAAPTAVPIHRDPFQADPVIQSATPRPPVIATVPRSDDLRLPSAAPVVSAVAIGGHPSAILEENGVSRIYTIGDRVGSHTIVGISLDGVRLDDGTLLLIAGTDSPSPAPRADAFPTLPIGAQPLPDVRGDIR
jgi:hypothetical protein